MSQLKFVRSKSTIRSSPLISTHQKLKLVQKPGKLHVSVGRSRQSSQTNEDLIISNPKYKRDLQILQLHQINENSNPLETSNILQSIILPSSHNTRLMDGSRNFSNSTQYNGNWGNIQNKQNYYTQTTCCSPKLSDSENKYKFDKCQKQISISETNLNPKFNQFAHQQTKINNQESNQEHKLKNSINMNKTMKLNQMSINKQNQLQNVVPNIKQNIINTKPIIDSSTKQFQKQIPKFFSEILTERSIILNAPKEFKDIEIQTSFSQNQKSEEQHIQCKSSTNAEVQTKSKNKNLGLFQYELSYMSPKINRNFLESDIISLDDYYSCGIQQENEKKIIKNQQLITQILRQDDYIDLDSQYLQSEPKEINTNLIDQNYHNKRSISKVVVQNSYSGIKKNKNDKGYLLQNSKCYKDHLNILINQQTCQDQNQPFFIQDKKQKQSLRNSNQNNKKKQKIQIKQK